MVTVADAVLAAVKAAVPGVRVEDVRPVVNPDNPPPGSYVVVSTGAGRRQRRRFAGGVDTATHRVQVMCVGPRREEVGYLARRIADHLMDTRIVGVTGWRLALPEHEVSRQPVRDDAVTARPLLFSIDEFVFLAARQN